jgi:hypothetical protein
MKTAAKASKATKGSTEDEPCGYATPLEYPVKTANYSERKRYYLLDTFRHASPWNTLFHLRSNPVRSLFP